MRVLLVGAGEAGDEGALLGAEPGRAARGGVLGHALGTRGGWDGDVAARVAQQPLEQRLRPGDDAEGAQRLAEKIRKAPLP